MEVMVSIVLLAIVGLANTGSLITGLQANKRTEVTNHLHNLAISKIEEFAGIDVIQIDASDSTTENNLTTAGTNLTFTRITNVVVNADGSRTVSVTVTCNSDRFNGQASYTSTFALFE